MFNKMLTRMDALASAHLDFVKKAFSDDGVPSSSRLLTLLHSVVGCGALVYIVWKTHLMPDGTTLGGLGAFSTAHYAVNRATTAYENTKKQPDADSKQ